MGKVNAKNVMNGTYGVLRIDGIEYANLSSFEAKITNNREDMQFSGNLGMDSKLLSSSGSGSMTLRKVNSRVIARQIPSIVSGKDFKTVIIATLDDPDALGKETISITDVWFNDFDLMKFEMGTAVEETVSFGFNPANVIPVDIVID